MSPCFIVGRTRLWTTCQRFRERSQEERRTRSERVSMVDFNSEKLSVSRQAELHSLNRSSLYNRCEKGASRWRKRLFRNCLELMV